MKVVVPRLASPLRPAEICGAALCALIVAAACSDSGNQPSPGSGGSVSTTSGGATSSGGTAALGGALATTGGALNATGGALNGSGGTSSGGGAPTGGKASGGSSDAAGMPGSGGMGAAGGPGTGGLSSTGGVPSSGGSPSTGGTSATGGKGGSGGKSDTGGTPSTGGTSNSGGTSNNGGTGGAATGGATATGGRAGSTGGSGGSGGVYRPCPTNGMPCKIMPFGDSITDGYGTAGGYRVELFRLAHQAGKNITFVGTGSNSPGKVDGVTFPPNHEGHSGFTIDTTPSRSGIAPLVPTVMPQFTPHIVLLMIGTNDCIDSYQLATAPTRLGTLIDSIFTRLPNILMVVAQPIPSQEDPLNTRIQSYNAAIPAIIKARADAGKHILLVDMYAPFSAVSTYKTTLLKDTWHPSEAGHAILGARWYSTLSPSL